MSTTNVVRLYDDLRNAIATQGALCVMYRTKGVELKARVIVPRNLTTTKDGADCVFAYDSFRRTELTFRVDRIATYHVIG
jgi:uncharacterized protein (DUF2235 family)